MFAMKEKQKNIYLDALEFGEKKLNERKSISRNELTEYLESKGYKFSTKEEKRLLTVLRREAFSIYRKTDPSNRKYYFKLNTKLKKPKNIGLRNKKYSIMLVFM